MGPGRGVVVRVVQLPRAPELRGRQIEYFKYKFDFFYIRIIEPGY